jgi:tetratricopeptide (TPR) repeat protein
MAAGGRAAWKITGAMGWQSCFKASVREAAGRSRSGTEPQWLVRAEGAARRGKGVVAAVREAQVEHRLASAVRRGGLAHPHTLRLVRQLAVRMGADGARAPPAARQRLVEAVEAAVPQWDPSMARGCVALALNRHCDVFDRGLPAEGAKYATGEAEAGSEKDDAVEARCDRWASGRLVESFCKWLGRCTCLPAPSGELRRLGDDWLGRRAFADAAAAFDAAAEPHRSPPYRADLHHRRALALLGLQQPQLARRELEAALRHNADHAPSLYCYGSLVYVLSVREHPPQRAGEGAGEGALGGLGGSPGLGGRRHSPGVVGPNVVPAPPPPTLEAAARCLQRSIEVSVTAADGKTREAVKLTGAALAAAYNNHAVLLAALCGRQAQPGSAGHVNGRAEGLARRATQQLELALRWGGGGGGGEDGTETKGHRVAAGDRGGGGGGGQQAGGGSASAAAASTIPLANMGLLLLSGLLERDQLARATDCLRRLIERSHANPQAHHALGEIAACCEACCEACLHGVIFGRGSGPGMAPGFLAWQARQA